MGSKSRLLQTLVAGSGVNSVPTQGLKWRAIEEHERLDLSLRDSKAFVQAMMAPVPVNDRLRDTIRRYREMQGT